MRFSIPRRTVLRPTALSHAVIPRIRLAGVLLGTTIAMVCALVVEAFRHEEEGDPPGFGDTEAQVEPGAVRAAQA